ncbi:MAG: hypothetical protein ACP5QO_09870, partial [Clostridia bacterium]
MMPQGFEPRLGGRIVATTNGGRSWTVIHLPDRLSYVGVVLYSATRLLALGETVGCEGLPGPCAGVVLQHGTADAWTVTLRAPGVVWAAWTRFGASGLWLSGATQCQALACATTRVLYRST